MPGGFSIVASLHNFPNLLNINRWFASEFPAEISDLITPVGYNWYVWL